MNYEVSSVAGGNWLYSQPHENSKHRVPELGGKFFLWPWLVFFICMYWLVWIHERDPLRISIIFSLCRVFLLWCSVLANSNCFSLLWLAASFLIFRKTQSSCGVMKSELGCESRAWFLDSAIPLSHCGTLLMHLPLYENSGSLLFHKRIALSDSSAPECTITYMCSVLQNLQTSLTSICSFIPPLCGS